jgi:hypothetical protein
MPLSPTALAKRRAYSREWRRVKRQDPLFRAQENAREREQRRIKNLERYQTNPEYRERQLIRNREKRTGWTEQARQDAYAAQDGRCALCRRKFPPDKLLADHCHNSGKPRELLCSACNMFEGHMRTRAELVLQYWFKHGNHAELNRVAEIISGFRLGEID